MEISRDYAYYKKHAQDVNLEDITSSQQNKNILQRLRDGDSDFTCLFVVDEPMSTGGSDDEFIIRWGDNDNDLGWLGYFIGESKILTELFVRIEVTGNSFIEGICRNQSIESLEILRDVVDYLSFGSMFKNNNRLDTLILDSFTMNAHDFAISLGQQSHLKCLHFHYMDLSDAEVSAIAKALIAQPQLDELKFEYNDFERYCCEALKYTFMKWGRKSQLKKLDLTSNAIDDEGLTILLEGLVCCGRYLTELTLSCSDLSAAGLRSLSSYFQNDICCVEILNLYDVHMDDNGAEALASGLTHSESLKRLDLSKNLIGDAGIAALASGLTTVANANLEELCLGENRFSTAGIRSLSGLIKSQRSTLKNLSLNRMQVDDDWIPILADALTNNTKLQSLVFNIRPSNNTLAAMLAFKKVLCDTSSINNIYLSNHTLQSIGSIGWRSEFIDGVNYFDLNRRRQQLEPEYRGLIPMIKILINYPDLGEMEPFYQWKLKFLPMIVAWLQKAGATRGYFDESVKKFQRREVSAVYKFIRGVPQLVADGYWSQQLKQVRLKKRKLDEREKQLLERLGRGKVLQ